MSDSDSKAVGESRPPLSKLIDRLPPRRALRWDARGVAIDASDDGAARIVALALRAFMSRPGSLSLDEIAADVASTTTEEWRALEQVARETASAFVSASLFHFLWATRRSSQHERPIRFADVALDRYRAAFRERIGNEELFFEALSAAECVGQIAAEINRPLETLAAMRMARELVESISPPEVKPGLVGQPARLLVGLSEATARTPEVLAELERGHATVSSALQEVQRRWPPYSVRPILETLAEMEALLGRDTGHARRLEQAESRLEEAAARGGSDIVAGLLLEEAAATLRELGLSERAEEALATARRTYERGAAQMTRISTTVTIPRAPVESLVEQALQGRGASESLAYLSAQLVPNWEGVREETALSARETPLQVLLPHTQIRDGRSVVSEAEGFEAVVRRHWFLRADLSVLPVGLSLKRLKDERGVTANLLADELVSGGVVPRGMAKALARAIDAVVVGEALVACHMLPALIEAALRQVCDARGLARTVTRGGEGRMLERSIGGIFDSKNVEQVELAQRILGPDLWHWYRLMLFDEAGRNLRHLQAHGALLDSVCTQETALSLLMGLFVLMQVAVPDAAGTNPEPAAR